MEDKIGKKNDDMETVSNLTDKIQLNVHLTLLSQGGSKSPLVQLPHARLLPQLIQSDFRYFITIFDDNNNTFFKKKNRNW